MNVLMLLSPKSEAKYLLDTYTLRQGLEVMRKYGYAALPVINKKGSYIGSVSEGDFLWYIVNGNGGGNVLFNCENERIKNIIRPELAPAVNVNVDMVTLVDQAMRQNFVPVVDDRGTFIGIVTRQSVIKMLRDGAGKSLPQIKSADGE